jgi:hypothetical protein
VYVCMYVCTYVYVFMCELLGICMYAFMCVRGMYVLVNPLYNTTISSAIHQKLR